MTGVPVITKPNSKEDADFLTRLADVIAPAIQAPSESTVQNFKSAD
jgi:hypothetical protein